MYMIIDNKIIKLYSDVQERSPQERSQIID